MLSVRTSAAQGRYQPGEWDVSYRTVRSRPPLVWFHGNQQTALTDYMGYGSSLRLMAQTHAVWGADLGGDTFGNDVGIARTETLVDYIDDGPVVLVGASMGAAVALNYAVRNPEMVTAVALVIPVVDLSAAGPGQVQLDAAYPPEYDDDDDPDHRAHNPIHFAGDLPASMPIGLWVSGNDPSVPPSTADDFVTARPQTDLTVFGDYGHGGVDVAVPLMMDWVQEHQ